MAKKLSKKDFAKQKQAEMKETINDAMDKITEHTESADDFVEYLDFMSNMYDYSPRNQMLLSNQYEGAYGVAGKKQFEEMGFNVHDNEKPLKVLAPVFKKYTIDENKKWIPLDRPNKEQKEKIESGEYTVKQKLSYFKFADVYDIGQTDAKAEDYPKMFPNRPYTFDERNINEKYPDLKKSIKRFAENEGYHLNDESSTERLGNAKGAYSPSTNNIYMRPHLSDGEYLSTLNHEIAHGQLHKNSTLDTPTKELEAEMTAYVTNKHFGLDTSDKAISYMASWTKNLSELDDKETIKVIERVSKASRTMISGIEKEYEDHVDVSKNKDVKMDIYNIKDDKPEFYEYKELDSLDADIFKDSREAGLVVTYNDKNKQYNIPFYEYRTEKENYESLEVISETTNKDSVLKRQSIFELENLSAKDYIDHHYEKSNQMANVRINTLNDQLSLYGDVEDEKSQEMKKDIEHVLEVKDDISKFLDKNHPEDAMIQGSGDSSGSSFDPRFNFRFDEIQIYKNEVSNAGFTKLEKQLMDQNANDENMELNHNNINQLKAGDMTFNYNTLKDEKVKDFSILNDMDSLNVSFKDGKELDLYKNADEKEDFNKLKSHGKAVNVKNLDISVKDYIQFGLDKSSQVDSKEYKIHDSVEKHLQERKDKKNSKQNNMEI